MRNCFIGGTSTKKHLHDENCLLFPLRTRASVSKFAKTVVMPMRDNLSQVKEMIFNFRSLAIQRTQIGFYYTCKTASSGFVNVTSHSALIN